MKRFLTVILIVFSFAVVFSGISSGQESTGAADKTAAEPAAAKVYVCDACKVTMDAPGKCPVCGMDLVVREITEMAPEAENPGVYPKK